jgi:hypothetical protein
MSDVGIIPESCPCSKGMPLADFWINFFIGYQVPIQTIVICDFKLSSPMRAVIAHTLCLAFFLIFTVSSLCAGDQSLDSIRKSITALDSARQTALQELEETTMSTNEVSDYKDFVVYLNTRIVNYCMDLAEQGGAIALEGLPCPKAPAMAGGSETPPSDDSILYLTGSDFGETKSQAEETADLEGAFLSSLGDFDDSLLKEKEKVAARVPSQRESGSSSASGSSGRAGESGDTSSGENSDSEEQGEGTADNQSREGQAGTAQDSTSRSGAQDSGVEQSTYGAPGGKLPPPEDDDIVARQLREAAEKEPDPELKKKLWEEYWKYKGVNKKRSDN